jgi:hypothetical protein
MAAAMPCALERRTGREMSAPGPLKSPQDFGAVSMLINKGG